MVDFPTEARLRRPAFNPGETLLNLPQKDTADGLDIAVFGAPFDGHTVRRDGARYGPAHARYASFNIRGKNSATGVVPQALARVADIGDAPVDTLDPFKSFDMLNEFCASVTKVGAVPLAVGGDNGITLAVMRAAASRCGPMSVIHFDAHPDTWNDVRGHRFNAGTVFRRASEEGLIDSSKHIVIGLRGTVYPDHDDAALSWAKAHQVTLVDTDECFAAGPLAIAERARNVVGDGPVFLTIDIDALDPTDMPGCTSPEPGGLRMRDVQLILRGLRGLQFVGGDINELSPPYDPTGITAFNTAHLLFEMLCLFAESLSGGRS